MSAIPPSKYVLYIRNNCFAINKRKSKKGLGSILVNQDNSSKKLLKYEKKTNKGLNDLNKRNKYLFNIYKRKNRHSKEVFHIKKIKKKIHHQAKEISIDMIIPNTRKSSEVVIIPKEVKPTKCTT